MKKTLLFSVSALILSASMFAQDAVDGCITHKAMNDLFSQNPEAKKRFEAQEAILQKQDAEAFKTGYKNGYGENEKTNNPNTTQGTIYYIPVVFQILHQNGPENITDQQVRNCVAEMNTRYRKLNADTLQTIPAFKGIAGDVQIEFRLASLDPSGNCTDGIIRYVDPHTVWLQNNYSWYTHTWPPTKYLNIYVVKSINGTAAAYTYLPGLNPGPNADVIVARYDYTGSTGASVASHGFCISHEAGHWLNLQHTWGNTNNPQVACGDDGVTDTPVTKGSNLVCNTAMSQCNPPTVENVQNYMDYSYCSTMFTNGQIARMRTAAVSSTGGRNNVISAANLTATGVTNWQPCIPQPFFHVTSRNVCTNTIITFSDSSFNAHPTQWQWNFPGGTLQGGTTLTDSMPKVSYAAAGVYAVSYTASTTAGSASITKTSYITVKSNVATYNTPYAEGFETTTLPSVDWLLSNTGGVDWVATSSAFATGAKSAMINNVNSAPNNISVLESTSFDLSGFSQPQFTFKAAYQQQATTNQDKLQVLTSTDCGNSWVSRLAKVGTALATVTPPSSTPFVPNPSDFVTYTVNINAVLTSTDVRFRFMFTTDPTAQGNNIYLDDINLTDLAAGINGFEAQLGLSIYPNPSSGNVNVEFNMNQKHNISVAVTDLLGRTIETIPAKQYAAGETTLNLAEKNYQSGVYLVNINVDGRIITKKIIIQ